MRSFRDAAEVIKCVEVVKILEANDYNGEKLTKKEFDKMFKGLNVCSLEWLKMNGFSTHSSSYVRIAIWDEETPPFAKTVRVAKKYYYTIDLDSLRKVATMGSEIPKEYFTEKLERVQQEVDKTKVRIDAL